MESITESRPARALIGATDTEALLRRLRLFSTFVELGEDARRQLLASGELLDLRDGQSVCHAGDHDDHIHHLIEGTLAIQTSDGVRRVLRAGEGPAREALDEAGEKTATIVAAPAARVLRIDARRLAALVTQAEAVPATAYTETFSGQQLAQLVDSLRNEHRDLGGTGASTDSAVPAPAPVPLVGDNTMGFELANTDLESTRPPAGARNGAADTRARSAAVPASITPDLEAALREQVAAIRAEERARANAKLQAYAAKLKHQAETQLRAKLKIVAARYETARATREQDVRKRYDQLLTQANRLAQQKAALYQARRQHVSQLTRSATVQRELAELGNQLRAQMVEIDALLPFDLNELTPPWPDAGD